MTNLLPCRYNNKTYRVDDIDWEKNPDDKFKTFDGSEISFVDYYKKVRRSTSVLFVMVHMSLFHLMVRQMVSFHAH